MNLNGRKKKELAFSIDIEDLLSKCNIQKYYTDDSGFDFQAFVRMALDFDETEAEELLFKFFSSESLKTQMNVEDTFSIFSDEELNLIYLDVMNMNIA